MTVNEIIYMALKVSDMSGVPMLLMGNPGTGKTTSVEYFAKANNMNMVLLRGSQSSPEEILGYEVNDGVENFRGNLNIKVASKICPKWFDKLYDDHSKGIRTLLFLDEITTASSFVQAALLQVIFGRNIDNGYNIPDDTLVVAAGNYASNLSSEFNLIPPLMNRFCIINITIDMPDIDKFLRKYRDRQDMVSKMKLFDETNSSDLTDQDQGFVELVQSTIEQKISTFTQGLYKSGKFDPNVTEMSDIYSDQSMGSGLLGFITMRTLNYFRDVSIGMYMRYGTVGVQSDAFRLMADGLVGISLSKPNKNGEASKERVSNEYAKLIEETAIQLDKRRVSSVMSTERQIERIITRLDTNGRAISADRLTSSELISLEKIFDSSINNREMRKLTTPIDSQTLLNCSDVIISSIRNTLKDSRDKIEKIKSSRELERADLDAVNGVIKNFNDSVKAYKKLRDFVQTKDFSYPNDIVSKISSSDKQTITKNAYKVDYIKHDLAKIHGMSMSELVETESL